MALRIWYMHVRLSVQSVRGLSSGQCVKANRRAAPSALLIVLVRPFPPGSRENMQCRVASYTPAPVMVVC